MREPETNGHPNGDVGLDHPMDVQSPVVTPDPSFPPAASSSNTVESIPLSTSYTTPNDDSCPHDDDVQPPPAKRPRVHSDADKASLANVSQTCLCAATGVLIFASRCRPSEVCHSTSSAGVSSSYKRCSTTNY